MLLKVQIYGFYATLFAEEKILFTLHKVHWRCSEKLPKILRKSALEVVFWSFFLSLKNYVLLSKIYVVQCRETLGFNWYFNHKNLRENL